MEATTTITAPEGATFTHSAYVYDDATGRYSHEVGPRLTFRRTPAREVKAGDLLMDAFGQPSIAVKSVKITKRTVQVTMGSDLMASHQTFLLSEVLNVFVSREDVRPVFVPGVTPESAL